MTRRVRLSDVEPPRLITDAETAHVLGMTPAELCRRQDELERIGMPKRHAVLGKRDARALHQWLEREFGLSSPQAAARQTVLARLEALGDGSRAN